MKPRTLALAGVAVAAVVTLAVVVPWRSSEAIGPDVDNDGVVDLFNDIYGVAAAFGQTFPTPTPITMSTYKLTSSCPGPSGAPCEVYCDPGDFATGGGYNAGGNSNVSTFPLVNAVGNAVGWGISADFNLVDSPVHAVCIDNPPPRP